MYLLKGAKSSEGTGIFTALIALWRGEMSDEKHEEIRRLGSALPDWKKKIRRFFSRYSGFSSNSVKEHDKKSKITGIWAETLDIFSCPSLLKRPICTFATSQKKWFTFKPIMITNSCSLITTKKQCNFFCISTGHSNRSCQLVLFSPIGFAWSHSLCQGVWTRWIKGTYVTPNL